MREPAIEIEGTGNIPGAPAFILPNRVDKEVVCALEKALGGRERVAWMVENSLRPSADVMEYLAKTRAAGFMCAINRTSREALSDQIHDHLKTRHVVLLCGKPGQQAGTLADVPGPLLSFFDDTTLSALPVYAGMYRQSPEPALVTSAPCQRRHLRFMPLVKAGAALGARVRAAWMEAEADMVEAMPAWAEASLPHALLRSLMAHPDALLIDGVDDTQMSFQQLLALSLMMGKRLRKLTSSKALGIILPPGKLAAIANVACLLAGITPVNINYVASASSFRKQAAAAGINRYMTETRFIHKQQQFAWPSQRDLIFVDRELAELGGGQLKFWTLLVRWAKPEFLAARIGLQQPQPDDMAMLLFTTATGGEAKGVPLSHRMLLAGAMQTRSRLPLSAGQRVLCALPLYQPAGLQLGLLLPLLSGTDMVTYPAPDAARRLCNLAHNYGTVLAAFTPSQTRAMLQAAKPDTFAAMRHFLVVGEKLPAELARRAAQELKLELHSCYTLTEAAVPVASCGPAAEPAPGTAHLLPTSRPGSVGVPLPGIALRISDLNRPEVTLPPTSMGLIWLRGAALMRGYLGNTGSSPSCQRGAWFCTGDVGRLDEDGLLTVSGRQARFSKIDGELVPHELLEELLCRILGIDPADDIRRIAVVGTPHPKGGGEILVLLSTVHKVVNPHDTITLRYGILNAHYPACWAPDRILAVTSIPTLPNGKLNYPLCYRGACRMLGLPQPQPSHD